MERDNCVCLYIHVYVCVCVGRIGAVQRRTFSGIRTRNISQQHEHSQSSSAPPSENTHRVHRRHQVKTLAQYL